MTNDHAGSCMNCADRTTSIRLLVDLPQDRCLARLGSGARLVALNSAARAGRVALIWPARARVPWAGRGSRGVCSARSSGALPARPAQSGFGQEEQMSEVIIGMDPHKRSATIEVMAADEAVLGGGRY